MHPKYIELVQDKVEEVKIEPICFAPVRKAPCAPTTLVEGRDNMQQQSFVEFQKTKVKIYRLTSPISEKKKETTTVSVNQKSSSYLLADKESSKSPYFVIKKYPFKQSVILNQNCQQSSVICTNYNQHALFYHKKVKKLAFSNNLDKLNYPNYYTF